MNKSDIEISGLLSEEGEAHIVGAISEYNDGSYEYVLETFEYNVDDDTWESSEDECYQEIGQIKRYLEKQYLHYWVFEDVFDAEDFLETMFDDEF